MPHKLLLTYDVKGDLVRGEQFTVSLTIKNIGDIVFGGGKIASYRLEVERLVQTVLIDKLPKVPALLPFASTEVTHTFNLSAEGHGWLVAVIQADDGQPVEHYQNPNFSTGGEWRNSIYITRREDAQIISLLQRIVELLSKRP